MTTREKIWRKWADRYVTMEKPIPLFETNEHFNVEYKHYGKDNRQILKRSEEMDALIRKEGRKVINDWSTTDDTYDGLIYMMYWLQGDEVIPLYIGKAGKYGRDGKRLSANLEDLRGGSTRKFARWGDAHYYHIGNLSAIVFDHSKNRKQKYQRWANQLFVEGRQLRQPVYFWTRAWKQNDVGLFHDFDVPLEQLEYQIIGHMSNLYPDQLLNNEGA